MANIPPSECARTGFTAALRLMDVKKVALQYRGMNITPPPVDTMRVQLDQLLEQLNNLVSGCNAEFAKNMIVEVKRAVVALPTREELRGQDRVTGMHDPRARMTNSQISTRLVQVAGALIKAEILLGKSVMADTKIGRATL